ncbi:MAG: entericidin A/B family lipoprotein [Woeseia sp.]
MKTFFYMMILMAFGLSMTACNTTRGFGEDVEATGEAVQDVAENTEEQIEEI